MFATAEPAAHRRQRRSRQVARGLVALAAAQRTLQKHHGGGSGSMGSRDHARARQQPGQQQRPDRPDWLCRKCVGTDTKPFRNYGDRVACFKCKLGKAFCHKENVTAPPPRSLAARQVQQQREGARVAKLVKENARLEKLLAKSKDEGDKGGEEQDTEEAETVVQVFE